MSRARPCTFTTDMLTSLFVRTLSLNDLDVQSSLFREPRTCAVILLYSCLKTICMLVMVNFARKMKKSFKFKYLYVSPRPTPHFEWNCPRKNPYTFSVTDTSNKVRDAWSICSIVEIYSFTPPPSNPVSF